MLSRRTDKRDVTLGASPRKVGPLRQKPISGMNSIDPVQSGDVEYRLSVKIRLDRLPPGGGTDQKRLVCLVAMQRESIFVTVDGNGPETEFSCSAKAADRNLGPVRDQQGLQRPWHAEILLSCRTRNGVKRRSTP